MLVSTPSEGAFICASCETVMKLTTPVKLPLSCPNCDAKLVAQAPVQMTMLMTTGQAQDLRPA